MIRVQAEARIKGISHLADSKNSGYLVAGDLRNLLNPGRPISMVGERIYQAAATSSNAASEETYSHRDGVFNIKEARLLGDLLKKHFVDPDVAREVKVCVTVFMSPEEHRHTYTEVVTYQIDPSKWTPRSHGVTTTTYKIPTLGVED